MATPHTDDDGDVSSIEIPHPIPAPNPEEWQPSRDPEESKRSAIHENPDVRQFAKFCIVGASSTVVNMAVTNLVYKGAHQSLFTAIVCGFFLSVLNGFFWNRRWTFKEKRGRSSQTQYLRFTLVSIVGLVLDTSIVAGVLALLTPDQLHLGFGHHFLHVAEIFFTPGADKSQFPVLLYNGALIAAIGCVVFWNYFANRHWTFKH